MAEPDTSDLLSLDRDVARAAARLAEWRALVGGDPELHAEDDPFDGIRRISAKSTRDALLAQPTSERDRPLRDALVRWIGSLLEARIGLPDEAALATETMTPRAPFVGEEARLVSWRQAWRGLVEARTVPEGRLWLVAASEAAQPVGAAVRRRAIRRIEAARRLGDPNPWIALPGVAPEAILSSAQRLLDGTEDVAAALRRERRIDDGGAAAVILDALARDASEGWPARLSPSWLERTFTGFAKGLSPALPRLPTTLGASSFARALYAFGFAARVATAPRSMPFVLAREPAFVGAHRSAFLFASLAADSDFHERALGLTRRVAQAQARALARAALLDARLHAARIVLSAPDGAMAPGAFEEITARLFGRPLDERLRGAWPLAREDEPARLVALLEATGLRATLVDMFDVDWHRNPRAWIHLHAQGSVPAWEQTDGAALGPAASTLGRAFEEALS